MSTIENDVRARVDEFVDELTLLIRRAALEAVHEALAGGSLPAAPRRGRPAGRKAKTGGRKKTARKSGGKRIRRTAEDLADLASGLVDYIRAHPGERLENISAALGATSKELRRPVQMLLAEGKLRTEGQRRGTTYFVGSGGKGAPKKKAGGRKAKRKTSKKKRSTKK